MTWQNGVAFLYISAVAFYVVYGFTIKDNQLKEVITKSGLIKVEVTNWLLGTLKLIYLLSMPALVILGIHLASEMAINGSAPATITDSLTTAMQVFLSIYVFTLGVFLILLLKNVLETFGIISIQGMSIMKSKKPVNKIRRYRNGEN